MLIGVNDKHEIKEINNVIDKTLNIYELDRERVFGGMSDFLILHYCYKPLDGGYSTYPARDYVTLQEIDNNEIAVLQAQVIQLEFEKRIGEI